MCGAPYPASQIDPFHLACPACGFILHENLRASVGALVLQDHQLLLVKRAIDPHIGSWDVPGGFTEPNEHPEQSVKREVKEELGVTCRVLRLFGVYAPNPYLYLEKLVYTCDLFYLVSIGRGLLKPSDDINGYRWFPLDHLPKDPDLAFPSTRKVLHDLKQSTLH